MARVGAWAMTGKIEAIQRMLWIRSLSGRNLCGKIGRSWGRRFCWICLVMTQVRNKDRSPWCAGSGLHLPYGTRSQRAKFTVNCAPGKRFIANIALPEYNTHELSRSSYDGPHHRSREAKSRPRRTSKYQPPSASGELCPGARLLDLRLCGRVQVLHGRAAACTYLLSMNELTEILKEACRGWNSSLSTGIRSWWSKEASWSNIHDWWPVTWWWTTKHRHKGM